MGHSYHVSVVVEITKQTDWDSRCLTCIHEQALFAVQQKIEGKMLVITSRPLVYRSERFFKSLMTFDIIRTIFHIRSFSNVDIDFTVEYPY